MKGKTRKQLFIGIICLSMAFTLWTTTLGSIRLPQEGTIEYVIFTGVFLPVSPENKAKSGAFTFTVHVRDKEWLFTVKSADMSFAKGDPWSVLHQIFPPTLRFWGNEKVIEFLKQPAIAGKLIKLYGTLYIGDNLFYVGEAREVLEKEK